jgi:hypothetical protein
LHKIEWRDSEIMLLLREFGMHDLQQEPHLSEGLVCSRMGSTIMLQGPLLLENDVKIKVLDRNRIVIRGVPIERNGEHARFRQLAQDVILSICHGDTRQVLEEFNVVAPGGGLPGKPPVRISSSQESDWQRLEGLYRELLGSPPGDWRQQAQRMGPGLVRCLILQRLKSRPERPYDAAVDLGRGQFSNHFPRYWRQLSLIYSNLKEAQDWSWASSFLVPPAGGISR